MRKSLLLLSCSFLFITQAYAAESDPILDDASEHLKLVKEAYIKKFEQMDANKDSFIDKDEYLKYQFETMREVVLTTSGFEDIKEAPAPKKLEVVEDNNDIYDILDKEEVVVKKENKTPEKAKTLNDFSATLEEMASFDLDFDEELSATEEQNKKRLTKEDVMPDMSEEVISEEVVPDEPEKEETLDEASAYIDELLKEDEELNELISKTEKQLEEAKQLAPASKTTLKKKISDIKPQDQSSKEVLTKTQAVANTITTQDATKEEKINKLIEESKKNLPQKIDDITTCTDIFYKDNMIIYNYSVNMDISVFPEEELTMLKEHIKTEACLPIYKEKCPEIAPVFIKEGTNVKINYIDKNGKDISYCELNSTTCQ